MTGNKSIIVDGNVVVKDSAVSCGRCGDYFWGYCRAHRGKRGESPSKCLGCLSDVLGGKCPDWACSRCGASKAFLTGGANHDWCSGDQTWGLFFWAIRSTHGYSTVSSNYSHIIASLHGKFPPYPGRVPFSQESRSSTNKNRQALWRDAINFLVSCPDVNLFFWESVRLSVHSKRSAASVC